MYRFTLQDLLCLIAVIREGSFQAAATTLHRSHAAVFAGVGKLEKQLGMDLLDRKGYRVRPTPAGLSIFERAQQLLAEADSFSVHAQQLATGEETELHVVISELCPRSQILNMLSEFFKTRPNTRLKLCFESVAGPIERLMEGDADLIFHHVDKTDTRLEWLDLGSIFFVPVVAPGFLDFPVTDAIAPDQMERFTQCILRDTANQPMNKSYFLLSGAPQCSVADHYMKKEIILRGMAWGHLPSFMIQEELENGQLLSIAGRYFPGLTEELVVARRRDRPHGPVARNLWKSIEEEARSPCTMVT